MMGGMKFGLMSLCVTVLNLVMWPAIAAAQNKETEILDARWENYTQRVTLDPSSTALTWLLLIFLALVCVASLFKNAKRTHLD